MASGVAGGSTASASSGSASAQGTFRTANRDAGHGQEEDGFAGVLANSSASSAADNASTGNRAAGSDASDTPAAPAATGDEHAAQADGEGADENAEPANLPDRLLALLGGAWPAPASAAPGSAASGADTASTLTANPSTLAGPLAPADAALGQLVAAGKPQAPISGAAILAGAAAPAAGALPIADVAQALGLAAAKDGGESLPLAPAATGADSIEFSLPGSQISANSPVRATAATVAATPIPMPADPDAGFDDALGARIGWLADQRIGRAEIRVSPDHLGPIDVRLHMDGNRVSAEFTSANADVRQALEASVGRLRDMLEQQGLQLAQSDVGSRQSSNPDSQVTDAGPDRHDADLMDTPAPIILRRGLLDEYA